MNNNLKNYSAQPDPSVWQNINGTMRRTKLRRQIIGATCGAAIVAAAIVAVVLWPHPVQNETVKTSMPVVAQQTVEPVQAEAESATAVATTPVVINQVQPAEHQPEVVSVVSNESTVAAHEVVVAPVAKEKPVSVAAPVVKTVVSAPVSRQEEQKEAVADPVSPVVADNTPVVKSPKVAKQEDTIMWFPNIFAPASGEPEVSTFRAHLSTDAGSVTNFKMSIFSRSGQMVFHTTDINQSWDGTYKGSILPQGTYVYVVVYTDKDKLQHQRKGTITLIR